MMSSSRPVLFLSFMKVGNSLPPHWPMCTAPSTQEAPITLFCHMLLIKALLQVCLPLAPTTLHASMVSCHWCFYRASQACITDTNGCAGLSWEAACCTVYQPLVLTLKRKVFW